MMWYIAITNNSVTNNRETSSAAGQITKYMLSILLILAPQPLNAVQS